MCFDFHICLKDSIMIIFLHQDFCPLSLRQFLPCVSCSDIPKLLINLCFCKLAPMTIHMLFFSSFHPNTLYKMSLTFIGLWTSLWAVTLPKSASDLLICPSQEAVVLPASAPDLWALTAFDVKSVTLLAVTSSSSCLSSFLPAPLYKLGFHQFYVLHPLWPLECLCWNFPLTCQPTRKTTIYFLNNPCSFAVSQPRV